ncbi:MAG: right-handed parallel beta-helix repeat-containing protein, partial [Planctomycetales bacterium]|nr:right-handed parallel beta-helix repeat-containing protein [Planctomycetales bacterium]
FYGYAVGLYGCNWNLNNSNLDRWVFRDNYNLLHVRDASNLTIENVTLEDLPQRLGYSYSSNVALRNVTLKDCGAAWMSWGDVSFNVANCAFQNCKNHYAIYTGYSPVTIDGTSFTGNMKTAVYAHYNSRLNVSNCTFTGGKDWAIWSCMNQPTATWDDNNRHEFVDCTISGNTYGLRLVHASNQNLLLKNTNITGNGWYSIMYDTCNLTVNDQATNNWRVANNTNGPVVRYGSVVLENVSSENNTTFGFFAEQGGHVTLVNCQSTGSKHGFFQNNANTTLIDRCRFEGRGESNWGWAVYLEGGPIHVRNSIFTKFHQGVLSQVLRGSSPTREFMNNTFAQMLPWASGLKVEAGSVTMRNNILAGNCSSGVAMRCSSGTVTQSHNLLDGFSTAYSGVTPSDSNVLKQARFVNAATGDFHLAKGSPAINSGTDLSAGFTTDMDGESRPAHHVFDIGAYEYSDSDGSVRVLKWIEHK